MIEQFSLQTVLTYLTLISVPIGVFYHILTLRNQSRTRQAQLFMGLYETYRSRGFRIQQMEITRQEWSDFDDFWERYGGEANPESWATWLSVAGFYNGIGVLVKRGLIDISLVDELLSNIIHRRWSIMGPILKGWRETRPSARVTPVLKKYELMHGFEYLYNEIMKREGQYTELKP
jgi:hypothetical protein